MKKVLIGLGILFGILVSILGLLLLFLKLLLPKGRRLELYIPRVGKDFYIPRVSKNFYIPRLRRHR